MPPCLVKTLLKIERVHSDNLKKNEIFVSLGYTQKSLVTPYGVIELDQQ